MKSLIFLALAGSALAGVHLEQEESIFTLNHPANSMDAVFVPPGICDDVHSIAGVSPFVFTLLYKTA